MITNIQLEPLDAAYDPQAFAAASSNLLRETLQHGFAAHNPAGPIYTQLQPIQRHNPQQNNLPSDIATINCDNWQRMDIDLDPNTVLRHELRMAGKLDFAGLGDI